MKPKTVQQSFLSRALGDSRYLRLAKPKVVDAPSLGELPESPWKHNPRDSYRKIVGNKLNTSDSLYATPSKGEKFVNIEESADLGDLGKYAADNAMYHPETYDEEEVITRENGRGNKMNEKLKHLLAADDAGKGVFDGKEDVFVSQTNPLKRPPQQFSQPISPDRSQHEIKVQE